MATKVGLGEHPFDTLTVVAVNCTSETSWVTFREIEGNACFKAADFPSVVKGAVASGEIACLNKRDGSGTFLVLKRFGTDEKQARGKAAGRGSGGSRGFTPPSKEAIHSRAIGELIGRTSAALIAANVSKADARFHMEAACAVYWSQFERSSAPVAPQADAVPGHPAEAVSGIVDMTIDDVLRAFDLTTQARATARQWQDDPKAFYQCLSDAKQRGVNLSAVILKHAPQCVTVEMLAAKLKEYGS